MPAKKLRVEPAGLGLYTIEKPVPFQLSTNVCDGVVWSADDVPTAKQLVELPHDTLVSVLKYGPRFALPTIFHRVPFHRSTSVLTGESSPRMFRPTAVQLVALTQETPSRPESPCAALSLGRIDQLAPFHRSVSVRP